MASNLGYYSLSELIYKELYSDIVSGKYKPGEQLVENYFQEKYSVSKSPIREAFQMLINDQLVERKPRCGCFVRTLDEKHITDIYEIRSVLESYAAAKTYENLDSKKISRLNHYYNLMKADAERNDKESYYEHHDSFQGFFSGECGNESISDFCSKLRIQNRWYKIQFSWADLNKDLHTHDILLEHFTKQDITAQEAQRLMQEHIVIGLQNFHTFMNSFKESKERN